MDSAGIDQSDRINCTLFWSVSWCCGNCYWLAIVLWCGHRSVSFQSFVLRHLLSHHPQHQETTRFCLSVYSGMLMYRFLHKKSPLECRMSSPFQQRWTQSARSVDILYFVSVKYFNRLIPFLLSFLQKVSLV